MVGGDFERGASMRVNGTTVFPHAMAFGATGDPAFSRYEGEVTAREARALGVQWVYYPVADVNNNPDNPIINIRSFGENPQDVAAQVKAFIEGAHADKTQLRAGHRQAFSGTRRHGGGHAPESGHDHGRPRPPGPLELVPFRAAIEAGVDSVMTAHIAVPALAPPDIPATLIPGDSDRPAAQGNGVQRAGGDRRAGDGRASPRASLPARPRCARSKPAPIRC